MSTKTLRLTARQVAVLRDGYRDHKLIRRAHPRTLDSLEKHGLIRRYRLGPSPFAKDGWELTDHGTAAAEWHGAHED